MIARPPRPRMRTLLALLPLVAACVGPRCADPEWRYPSVPSFEGAIELAADRAWVGLATTLPPGFRSGFVVFAVTREGGSAGRIVSVQTLERSRALGRFEVLREHGDEALVLFAAGSGAASGHGSEYRTWALEAYPLTGIAERRWEVSAPFHTVDEARIAPAEPELFPLPGADLGPWLTRTLEDLLRELGHGATVDESAGSITMSGACPWPGFTDRARARARLQSSIAKRRTSPDSPVSRSSTSARGAPSRRSSRRRSKRVPRVSSGCRPAS